MTIAATISSSFISTKLSVRLIASTGSSHGFILKHRVEGKKFSRAVFQFEDKIKIKLKVYIYLISSLVFNELFHSHLILNDPLDKMFERLSLIEMLCKKKRKYRNPGNYIRMLESFI